MGKFNDSQEKDKLHWKKSTNKIRHTFKFGNIIKNFDSRSDFYSHRSFD
jgi:hypothetical protein